MLGTTRVIHLYFRPSVFPSVLPSLLTSARSFSHALNVTYLLLLPQRAAQRLTMSSEQLARQARQLGLRTPSQVRPSVK